MSKGQPWRIATYTFGSKHPPKRSQSYELTIAKKRLARQARDGAPIQHRRPRPAKLYAIQAAWPLSMCNELPWGCEEAYQRRG